MKNYMKIGLITMFASLFIFLVACQSKDEQKTETIEASEEQIASQSESEIDVTEMLLPLKNSEKRTTPITHIMIHFTSNVTAKPEGPYDIEDTYQVFEDYGVSAHYLIDREGTIHQMVHENRVAYHAGAGSLSSFPDYEDKLNDYSIGIELMAIGTQEEMDLFITEDTYNELDPSLIGYTDAQYEALDDLLERIHIRYPEVERNRERVI